MAAPSMQQFKIENLNACTNAAHACKLILIIEYLSRTAACHAGVDHNVALFTVDADMMRTIKLPRAADGSNMAAVGMPQHLHAIIFAISNNNVLIRIVERKSNRML
jgi:hypothetical protein